MKISKQAKRAGKALYQTCLVNGVLDEPRCRQAVDALLTAKPRGCLAILDHFLRLVKLDTARHTARVESALALDAANQEQVKRMLTSRYGPGLRFEFATRQELLGGVRVRVGSDVFDSSVRGRLQGLAEEFNSE